jgi:hypothetical protein
MAGLMLELIWLAFEADYPNVLPGHTNQAEHGRHQLLLPRL